MKSTTNLPPDELRLRQCEGKAAFDSARLAVEVRDRRNHNGHRRANKGETYKCPHCSKWHLGRLGANKSKVKKTVRQLLP